MVDWDGSTWWQEVSEDAYWRWQKARGDGSLRVGFPRFRRRGRDADRYRVTTGSFGLSGRRHVKLPRIGRVRVHENTRRLHWLLELDRAKLLNVTVRRRGRRLMAVFTVELVRPQTNTRPTRRDSVVGVDAGVRHLATVMTGEGEVVESLNVSGMLT